MFGNKDTQQQDDQFQVAPPPVAPAIMPPDPAPSGILEVNPAEEPVLPSPSGMPGSMSAPAPSSDESAAPAPATTAPPTVMQSAAPIAGDELLSLKQEALQQLSPLVGHLDQTPEERFRTTMMMIQATDDHTKIKEAYDAAKQITDDKARAQALLDVVNEINYFTQHQQHNNPEAPQA